MLQWLVLVHSDGAGFSLACKDFGKMFDQSPPVLFVFCFFLFVLKWRLAHTILMSGSVYSWDDCGWIFPDKLHVSCFQIGSHTMPAIGIVSPLRLRWPATCTFGRMAKVYYVPLRQHRGGTDTKWEQAHKVNSEEENSPATPARIRTRNLSIASLALLPTSYPGSIILIVYPTMTGFSSYS